MRILFTFAGGSGHLEPLLPFAEAALGAGHTVAFAGRSSAIEALPGRGFTTFPEASPPRPVEITPLLEVDMEREERDLRDGFAERIARAHARRVLELVGDWSPDLIVRDEVDFGSAVAVERVGLSCATVLVIAAGSFVRAGVVGEPLARLRAAHGLPPDPGLGMLTRHLVLSPFPPSFRDPAFPLPATAHSFRLPAGDASAPAWLAGLPERRTVYFTLGTVFALESGDLFSRVLAGLRELPVNVVVTVGREVDPAALGPQPANVRIERYLPQAALFPRCHAVVSHGGSGTVIGALAAGLPQVLLAMGADQPLNAARCQALGAGISLDPVRATPNAIRDAVAAVLDEPSYQQAAERVRDEIASLPEPSAAVPLLERLAEPRTGLSGGCTGPPA